MLPRLLTSHCWAQPPLTMRGLRAVVPTRDQFGLGTLHALMNCFAIFISSQERREIALILSMYRFVCVCVCVGVCIYMYVCTYILVF